MVGEAELVVAQMMNMLIDMSNYVQLYSPEGEDLVANKYGQISYHTIMIYRRVGQIYIALIMIRLVVHLK